MQVILHRFRRSVIGLARQDKCNSILLFWMIAFVYIAFCPQQCRISGLFTMVLQSGYVASLPSEWYLTLVVVTIRRMNRCLVA